MTEIRPPENALHVPDSLPRRRRYARSMDQPPLASLTPVRLEILRHLAELRFLSLPQIARLCCLVEGKDIDERQDLAGRQDLSEKRARRHMRALFDAGLVDVLPVSRAALAPPGSPNDASLLYGSAPNVYTATRAGLDLLRRAGLTGEEASMRPVPRYGPRNGLFLAHELLVRDVRVWLERCARQGGHEVERWRDGEEAAMGLGRTRAPLWVRPDAWFACRLGAAVLVGLVEVDRGTERGKARWAEKLAAYGALFSGDGLRAATGYLNARVLVLTPDAARRDALAALIANEAGSPGLAGRFWVAEQVVLNGVNLRTAEWRRPGHPTMHSLIPEPIVAVKCR